MRAPKTMTMADKSETTGPQLLQQGEKVLLHPVHPHLISYCPTMDLVAVVTDEENLDVYRINGQRAFGLKRKSEDETVDLICWELNGQAIAVAWSDGSTDIVSSDTGKIIHKDLPPPRDNAEERIKCIGWGLNFIDVDVVKRRTGVKKGRANGKSAQAIDLSIDTTEDWDTFKDDATLEDFLQRQPDFESLDVAPDLPDQLAMMDIETLLPKLPAIPMPPAQPFMMRAPQIDSGTFSSQSQVDSLLHSHHMKDHNSVDMFIRCTDHGTVHPSIYDSLETVNVHLPSAWRIKMQPIIHASHPYSCSHVFVSRFTSPDSSQKKLAFIPLTLGFIPSAGIYLHLIASKTAQLQNLLQYLQQCCQRIHTFFKHSQSLPSKFMRNISEVLEEKGQGDLVTNLYHLACTGDCPPPVHEWLVDELAEQGHKRWDTTVTGGFSTLITLLHENFIPAIDRCSIVISRLRGLAKFHEQDWIFSGPISDFTALLDLLKNLRLLAHTCLTYTADEKRQFHAFSKWLRFCIDFEATEEGSQSRADMENKDPGVDIGTVLEYIRYGMMKSDLQPYLRSTTELDEKKRVEGPATYDDTRKAIDMLREGATFKEEALCLEHVLGQFGAGVTKLLKQVSLWQENNITMDSGIVLEEGDFQDATMDMRMVFESTPNTVDSISTYIALIPASAPSTIHIHHLTHDATIHPLPDALQTFSTTILDFSSSSSRPDTTNIKVLDVKFTDDKSLLVLLQLPDDAKTCVLASLPYTSSPSSTRPPPPPGDVPIGYIVHDGKEISTSLLPNGHAIPETARYTIQISDEVIRHYACHVFEGRFTPMKIYVNGRKGRRVVVVLGSDRKHYRVLDLDFKARSGGGGEGEEDSDTDSDVEMSGA